MTPDAPPPSIYDLIENQRRIVASLQGGNFYSREDSLCLATAIDKLCSLELLVRNE